MAVELYGKEEFTNAPSFFYHLYFFFFFFSQRKKQLKFVIQNIHWIWLFHHVKVLAHKFFTIRFSVEYWSEEKQQQWFGSINHRKSMRRTEEKIEPEHV